MYDAFTEVESSVQKGPTCHTVLYHVTLNVEGIEDLCESDSISGTRWKYTLDLKWSDQKNNWEFADSEMVDDQQIDLSDIGENEVESLIEGIFQQIDLSSFTVALTAKPLTCQSRIKIRSLDAYYFIKET